MKNRPVLDDAREPCLFINGKFAAQRSTGVQRSAQNLVAALDHLFAEGHCDWVGRSILLIPPGAAAPELRRIETAVVGIRAWPLHVWEQIQLPFASRHGLLLNLTGSAPMIGRRQLCMLHDAAVFDTPKVYTTTFKHWYRTLFRLLVWRRTPMLTVSAFSRQRLAARLRIAASRIAVVPNGGEHLQAVTPDREAVDRLGLTPGRYLLAVGSYSPNKNLDALQNAFRRLRVGQGVKLAIVGAPDERVFSRPALPDTDSSDAGIVRAGPLNDAALKSLYLNAAGLVFPSLYEGFGLPPLEAMACGCPVAASNAAAIPEVCGDAALYFDPSSVEQMAQRMQALLDDAALRDVLRRAGKRQVDRYTWPRAAEALLSALRPLLTPESTSHPLAVVATKASRP